MIPPLGSVTVDAPAEAGANASAQVFSTVPVAGLVETTLPVPGAAAGLTEASLLDDATIPVFEDAANGGSTGLIIVNSAAPSNIKLTLHAMDGTELSLDSSAVEFVLPAYGARTVFVRDVFPRLGDFRGTMTVEGGIDRPQEGGPFAVTVVQTSDGVPATLETIRGGRREAARPMRFVGFRSGGDVVSSIGRVQSQSAAAGPRSSRAGSGT